MGCLDLTGEKEAFSGESMSNEVTHDLYSQRKRKVSIDHLRSANQGLGLAHAVLLSHSPTPTPPS